MKNQKKRKGQMYAYFQWPLYLGVLVICMNVVVGAINLSAGLVMFFFTLIYLGIAGAIYVYKRKGLLPGLVDFSADYAWVQKKLLMDLDIPYAMTDETGHILWMNQCFSELVQGEKSKIRSISVLFPELTKDVLEKLKEKCSIHTSLGDGKYRVDLKPVRIQGIGEAEELFGAEETANEMIAVYLFDETEILRCRQEINDQKMVAGLIYLDNYDEALESVEEVRRSLLTALIDRKINKYISGMNGITKKLEKDKYLLLFNHKYLEELRADKFAILEEVRTTDIGNSMAVTLSIGVAAGYDNFNKNYEMARAAIDLALGRGGDQTVVKEGDQTTFFGGKSTTVEKNTRVKARVKAHALRELIEVADNVIIMGHKISDADALGAAIGIYRASKALNKHANIVLNDVTRSLRPTVETFTGVPEYEEDLFIRNSEAMQYVSDNTLLVVVDVNRPGYTECPELVERCRTIVVLDHHRQSGDTINHAVLSYIEPYASSTCEMVAEILQYIGDNVKLKSAEANAIYAGIIVDTNNFTNKAGVRTFEAAAFIRRSGADIIKVRKLLRDDMNEYKARAEAVRHAEVYRDSFALAVCPSANLESPTIVGAQAANELLNINGVKASIVFTYFNNEVYLSARSIDEVNVQLIMEKLGGGGHMTIAGAQLKDVTVDEAIELVKKTLDGMIEEGEI